MPRIVREDELAAANAITTTITNAAIAVGPALGGLFLVLGSPAWAFTANAVTFLASALIVARIRSDLGPDRDGREGRDPRPSGCSRTCATGSRLWPPHGTR